MWRMIRFGFQEKTKSIYKLLRVWEWNYVEPRCAGALINLNLEPFSGVRARKKRLF